jgi:hypothetical protein
MIEFRIEFSRHARRRMSLYGITEETIRTIIKNKISESGAVDGKNEIVDKGMASQFGYPIKVVFTCERNEIVVVTAYPLKRERKK